MDVTSTAGKGKDDALTNNPVLSAPRLSISSEGDKYESTAPLQGALRNKNIRVTPTIYVLFMPLSGQSDVFPQIDISDLKDPTLIDNYTISFPENEWSDWDAEDKERMILELKLNGWTAHFQRIDHVGVSEIGIANKAISDDSKTLPLLVCARRESGYQDPDLEEDIEVTPATAHKPSPIKIVTFTKIPEAVPFTLFEKTLPRKDVLSAEDKETWSPESITRTDTSKVLGFDTELPIRKRIAESVDSNEERHSKAPRLSNPFEERKSE